MVKQAQHVHSTFSRWLASHKRAISFAFNELLNAPIVNSITLFVIGIAIALPLGFYILLQNLQTVNTEWNTNAPTISLYLKSHLPQNEIDTLVQSLKNNNEIKNVDYVSPSDGLKTFEKNTPFTDVISLFQHNPLPGVITVLPTEHNQSPEKIQILYTRLKSLPDVSIAQLDMNWVTRLFDVITIGKKITNALSLLFGVGVILIIGHTLRTSLSDHINEVQVMRLIGATNGYIRRPLLYRGLLYGLLGALVAWLFINLFLHQLQLPVSQLAQTYHAPFYLKNISFEMGITVMLIAGFAGLISAWLITAQFLNQPELSE